MKSALKSTHIRDVLLECLRWALVAKFGTLCLFACASESHPTTSQYGQATGNPLPDSHSGGGPTLRTKCIIKPKDDFVILNIEPRGHAFEMAERVTESFRSEAS